MRQSVTASLSASGQDLAAGSRSHTLHKAVLAAALALLWLISSFGH